MPDSRCPACGERVVRPAQSGGVIIKSRYIHQTATGELTIGCPNSRCKVELEVRKGRLLLFAKSRRSGAA